MFKLHKPHGCIHSGHFMVSRLDDDEDNNDPEDTTSERDNANSVEIDVTNPDSVVDAKNLDINYSVKSPSGRDGLTSWNDLDRPKSASKKQYLTYYTIIHHQTSDDGSTDVAMTPVSDLDQSRGGPTNSASDQDLVSHEDTLKHKCQLDLHHGTQPINLDLNNITTPGNASIKSDPTLHISQNTGQNQLQLDISNHHHHHHHHHQHAVTIDTSLTKLLECMSLYYCSNLTSPKWKSFKGLKLRLKYKIRLNNLIWRAWFLQCIRGRRPPGCQFNAPIETDVHKKCETIVLEGKYWKRKEKAIVDEYKKWRIFHKQKSQLNYFRPSSFDWENRVSNLNSSNIFRSGCDFSPDYGMSVGCNIEDFPQYYPSNTIPPSESAPIAPINQSILMQNQTTTIASSNETTPVYHPLQTTNMYQQMSWQHQNHLRHNHIHNQTYLNLEQQQQLHVSSWQHSNTSVQQLQPNPICVDNNMITLYHGQNNFRQSQQDQAPQSQTIHQQHQTHQHQQHQQHQQHHQHHQHHQHQQHHQHIQNLQQQQQVQPQPQLQAQIQAQSHHQPQIHIQLPQELDRASHINGAEQDPGSSVQLPSSRMTCGGSSSPGSIIAMDLYSPRGSSSERNNGEEGRVCHVNAEQKRRCNIKNGFDTLKAILPSVSNCVNVKISKASMLQKAAIYINNLESAQKELMKEQALLKQQIESLKTSIGAYQAQLPQAGNSLNCNNSGSCKAREVFHEYIRFRSKQNWKFWAFSLIIGPLFETYYKTVSAANVEDSCKTMFTWLDENCNMLVLRRDVLGSLTFLSTHTNILQSPNTLAREATAQCFYQDNNIENHQGRV